MYEELGYLAINEFADVITDWQLFYRRATIPLKLRLQVCDGTYIDIWSNILAERYAYHWEQRAIRGLIYRHDNAPDHPDIPTFPKHFHNGSEENVQSSVISDDPKEALREFLSFAREKLAEFERD